MQTILLVDDSMVVRRLCGKALSSLGYKVLLAHDGEDGLRIFRREVASISAVVLDVQMPGMGGAEAYIRMRRLAAATPVVVSTALDRTELPPDLLFADGYIRKPWTVREISAELTRVMDGLARPGEDP